MKKLFYLVSIILLSSCFKQKEVQPEWDTSRTYTVEGYMLSRGSETPVVGKTIAISQERKKYKHSDPHTVTDSTGHFKLTYTPSGSKDGLNVYPVYADYSCIYSDISFISGISKGEDVNLKKVYTALY